MYVIPTTEERRNTFRLREVAQQNDVWTLRQLQTLNDNAAFEIVD